MPGQQTFGRKANSDRRKAKLQIVWSLVIVAAIVVLVVVVAL
jgi:hypothetical protein